MDKLKLLLEKFFKRIKGFFVRSTKKTRTYTPRKYNKEKGQNFSELLDQLEQTFEYVKLPTMNESWLDRDSIVGLKKLGAHAPNPWIMDWYEENSVIDVSKPLPAIMCITASSKYAINRGDKVYPKIIFAIKHKKLPWHVAYKPGAPYQFGMAFDLDGKLFWVHMYITVNRKTGEIYFCDELIVDKHVVPVRDPRQRRAVGAYRTYATRKWRTAEFLVDDTRTIEESQKIVRNCFVNMHRWWLDRDSRWNVVIKKNGERVTFGVNNDQTPYYFKDRDKTVRTPAGQIKKIVHYVKQHDRKVKEKVTTVREHIRGLQEFEWKGYHCKVISPKLQTKTSSSFDQSSVDEEKAENVVYLSKVGKLLADFEESSALRKVG